MPLPLGQEIGTTPGRPTAGRREWPDEAALLCAALPPTILATACVGQNITRYLGQTEYVVEFAIGEQPSIGGHYGTTKVWSIRRRSTEPNSIRFRFPVAFAITASRNPE